MMCKDVEGLETKKKEQKNAHEMCYFINFTFFNPSILNDLRGTQ